MKLFQAKHVTSSPNFPQSNGFAEAMVKIVKKLMDHSTTRETMEFQSYGIQMYSNHGEHSFTIGASNWSKTQDRSSIYTTR